MTSWYLNNFDYLKNERSYLSEIKNIFLVSQVFLYRYTKQTSRNIADTTFKEKWWNSKKWNLFVAAPPEKSPPLIRQISSRISKIVQPSPVNYLFKKCLPHPPSIQKGWERHRQQSIVLYFLHIMVHVCISTMYLYRTEGHFKWLGLIRFNDH